MTRRRMFGTALLAAVSIAGVGTTTVGAAVTAAPTIHTVAGNRQQYPGDADWWIRDDGGPATSAFINSPEHVAVGPDGSVYVDDGEERVRRFTPGGTISTVAGRIDDRGGLAPKDGDLAVGADFVGGIEGLAVRPDGHLVVATSSIVWQVVDGHLERLVGNGSTAPGWPSGIVPDGTPGRDAGVDVRAIGLDAEGRLLLNDNLRVRRLETDGTLTTIAGNGSAQKPVETSPALATSVDAVSLAGAPDGSIYAVVLGGATGFPPETWLYRIDPNGSIRGVVGNQAASPVGDFGCGPGPRTYFGAMREVAVSPDGRVYISGLSGVSRLRVDGTLQDVLDGVVRTGPPIDTTTPTRVQGMAIDADGKLLFADPANNVVEQVDPVPDVPLPGYCRLLPFTSADAFVFRQLDDFDAPIPLQSQLDVIERQLLSGAVTPEQMIDFYAHGAAWSTKVGALSRLYAAYFKRVPDTGGLAGWKARLDSGAALRVVSDAFAASPEFRQTYGRLANGAFVDLVYRNVLGRAPDAAGRRHWLGYLSRGYSRGWLMLQFSESREFKLRSASRTDAVLLRYGMLRQAPTQAQSDLWARRVAAGTLDTTLIGEIYDSAAYAARVVPRPPR